MPVARSRKFGAPTGLDQLEAPRASLWAFWAWETAHANSALQSKQPLAAGAESPQPNGAWAGPDVEHRAKSQQIVQASAGKGEPETRRGSVVPASAGKG
jgi:hypothetical protein